MSQHEYPAGQAKLILIEPEHKASQQFSNLRQELERNKIPFELLLGFDQAKDYIGERDTENMMVINNSYYDERNIPREIFGYKNTVVYCYPKESKNKDFSSLRNSQHVINAFRKLGGQAPVNPVSTNFIPNDRSESKSPSHKIRLKSIKKDIKKNKDGMVKEPYERIMIIHPKNPDNTEYLSLVDALKSQKKYVEVLKGQNQVKRFRGDKALLILQKEVFDDVNKFINSERMEKKIDIAVLGFKKGLLLSNHVIVTEKASDITDYILESGLEIPGLRDRLDKNIMTSRNIIKSNKQLNLNGSMEDFMSPERQHRELNDSKEGGLTSKLIRQEMVKEVASPQINGGQNILITSKVSQAGSVDKSKVPKKIKKIGKKNGSVLEKSNSILLNNQIHRVQPYQQGTINNEEQSKQNTQEKHWKIYPDKNKTNATKTGPLFIMEPMKSKKELEQERQLERQRLEKQRARERELELQREKERQMEREREREREIQREKERERQQSYTYSNNRNSDNQVIYEMSEEYRGSNPSEYMNYNNDSMASRNSLSGNISNSAFNRQPGSPMIKTPQNYSSKNYENTESEQMRRNSEIGLNVRKPTVESRVIKSGVNNTTNKSIEENIQANTAGNKLSPTTVYRGTEISQPATTMSKAKGLSTEPATYTFTANQENKTSTNHNINHTNNNNNTTTTVTRTVVTNQHWQPAEYNSSRAGVILHQHPPIDRSIETKKISQQQLQQQQPSSNSTNKRISTTSHNISTYQQQQQQSIPNSTSASNIKSHTNTLIRTQAYSPRQFNPDDYDISYDAQGRKVYRAKSPIHLNTTTNIGSYQRNSPTQSPRPASPVYRTANTIQPIPNTNNNNNSYNYNTAQSRSSSVHYMPQASTHKLKYHEPSPQINYDRSQSNNLFSFNSKGHNTSNNITNTNNNNNTTKYTTQNKIVATTNNLIPQDQDSSGYRYKQYHSRTEQNGMVSQRVMSVQQRRSVDKRPSIQMRVEEVERKSIGMGYKPSNFVNTNTNNNNDLSSAGSVYSNNKIVGYTSHNNYNNNNNNASDNQRRMSKISNNSYSNQSSALTHHYFANQYYSANTTPLYGQSKPYHATITTRIESADMYNNIEKEYENLSLDANIVHYIIDTTLPHAPAIEAAIPYSSFKDRLDTVGSSSAVLDRMSKQELPSSLYDIGFIFVAAGSLKSSAVTAGYHLVEVDENFPQLDISGDKNIFSSSGLVGGKNSTCKINMARAENLSLVKKLLLAPLMEHYIFYHKNDQEMTKTLKLFPNNKFQKFGYTTRKDLENTLSLHLKNKGRLVRALIFVNEDNIRECAPVMNSYLNLGTFNMICHLHKRNNADHNALAYQYPKVTFSSDFNFNSYGSVINFATHQNLNDYSHDEDQFVSTAEPAPIKGIQQNGQIHRVSTSNSSRGLGNLMIASNVSESHRMAEEAAQTLRRGLGGQHSKNSARRITEEQINRSQSPSKRGSFADPQIAKRTIYLQDQHKKQHLHEQIERRFPNMYDIKFFNSLENLQLPSNSGVEFVILHPQGDFIGGEITDRHAMYVMLGETERLPSGVGKFHNKNELFEYL